MSDADRLGPRRPLLSSAPVDKIDETAEIDSADLAQAERLFRIGSRAALRVEAPDAEDAKIVLIASQHQGAEWQICAIDDATPFCKDDEGSPAAKWALKLVKSKASTKILDEAWEEAHRKWDLEPSPAKFLESEKQVFAVALPLTRTKSRFLALFPTFHWQLEVSLALATEFCQAVSLAESFVDDHISSFTRQEKLSGAWSQLLEELGDLGKSLGGVASSIARMFRAGYCQILLIYGPDGTLQEPPVKRLYRYPQTASRKQGPAIAEGEDPEDIESEDLEVVADEDDDMSPRLDLSNPGTTLDTILAEIFEEQRNKNPRVQSKYFKVLNSMTEFEPPAALQESGEKLTNLAVVPIPISKRFWDEALTRLGEGHDGPEPSPRIHGLLALGNLYRENAAVGEDLDRRFRHLDILRLHQVAGNLAIALEGQAYHVQSLRDPGTGIFNRAHLDRFCRTRMKRDYGVIFIDVDNFKQYNTKFGYDGGDRIIEAVAKILQEETESLGRDLRVFDVTAYRDGGDEFVVTLCKKESALADPRVLQLTEKLAYRIQSRAREAPFQDGERSNELGLAYMAPSGISMSIGVSYYAPQPRSGRSLRREPGQKSKNYSEEWRYAIQRSSRASQIAKSAGGNSIVSWQEVGNFAEKGTPIISVYENKRVLILGGFREGLREGFIFETYHAGVLARHKRPCAKMKIERTYPRVSVCEVLMTEKPLVGWQKADERLDLEDLTVEDWWSEGVGGAAESGGQDKEEPGGQRSDFDLAKLRVR